MRVPKFKGLWIPIEIIMDDNLNKTEMLLLSDIAYFQEYYKSREEISKMLKISKERIANLLKHLVELGYIEEIGNRFNRKIYRISKKIFVLYKKNKMIDWDIDEEPENEIVEIVSDEEEFIQELNQTLGGKARIRAVKPRIKKLQQRMKTFSKDEIREAAFNLSQSEFHMGKNDGGIRYGTVDFLLRSDVQLENWLNNRPQRGKIRDVGRRIA